MENILNKFDLYYATSNNPHSDERDERNRAPDTVCYSKDFAKFISDRIEANRIAKKSYDKELNKFLARYEKFWTDEHDAVILRYIEKYQWYWLGQYDEEALSSKLNKMIFAKMGLNEASQNVEMYKYNCYRGFFEYIIHRAYVLGYYDLLKEPQWKVCPICNKNFHESSIKHFYARAMGKNKINICMPCLEHSYRPYYIGYLKDDEKKDLEAGKLDALKENCRNFIKKMYDHYHAIPNSNVANLSFIDLTNSSLDERIELLCVIHHSGAIKHYKKIYGSWIGALIDAGLIENGIWKTSRGYHCLAEDGHICLSMAEKSIDDYLYHNNIKHEKEPRYPEGNYRGDFLINGIFVEYFGLVGDKEYDKKIKIKRKIAQKYNVQLIEIYPHDIMEVHGLDRCFKQFL